MNCPACSHRERVWYSRTYGPTTVRHSHCCECGTEWVYKHPSGEVVAVNIYEREIYIAISPDPDRNTDTDQIQTRKYLRRKRPANDPDFAAWYQEYPRKVGRVAAERAWHQMAHDRPPLSEMLAALSWQTKSPDWAGLDRSRYIPHPATYLRAGRWADEKPKTVAPQYQDLSIGTKWERRG